MKKQEKRYAIVGKLPNSDVEKILMARCEGTKITNKTLAQRLKIDLENEYLCTCCKIKEVSK